MPSDVTIRTLPRPIPNVNLVVSGSPLQAPIQSSTLLEGNTLSGFSAGDYHLVTDHPEYESLATDFSVDGVSPQDVELMLVAKEDSGEEGLPEGPVFSVTGTGTMDFDPASQTAAPPTMDAETYEKIYGNNDFENYFTSAQARVYIGNLFIDEMRSIQFQLQSNLVPVYGYASRFADAYGEGKSLVQGQLILNYISEGYLFTVLDEYQQLMIQSPDEDEDDRAAKQLKGLLDSRKARFASGELPIEQFSADRLLQRLAGSPAAVERARKLLLGEGFDPVYMNGTYLRIPFDMTVEIGVGAHRTYRRLEKCRIISNEQIVDPSGKTIVDAYGFIARRLR